MLVRRTARSAAVAHVQHAAAQARSLARLLPPALHRRPWLLALALLLLVVLLLRKRAGCWLPSSSPSPTSGAWSAPNAFPFHSQAAVSAALNFTVVLNTYQRPALLSRALAHYAACGPQVSAVRVVWSEQRPTPQRAEPSDARFFLLDSASQSRDYMPSVSYDTHPTSSINNRFAPLKGLSSDAVFSVDDDMAVPCNALLDAFAAWRAAPHALVGFYPRLHERSSPAGCAAASYRYVSAEPALLLRRRYSLVLTKAAFLHASYLDMYTRAMPPGIRDYIASRRECEDIAMAFLVANATRAGHARGRMPSVWVRPPLSFWVGAKLDGIGRKGLSAGQVSNHHAMRGACVAHFASFYDGRVPLVTQPLRDTALRAPPDA